MIKPGKDDARFSWQASFQPAQSLTLVFAVSPFANKARGFNLYHALSHESVTCSHGGIPVLLLNGNAICKS